MTELDLGEFDSLASDLQEIAEHEEEVGIADVSAAVKKWQEASQELTEAEQNVKTAKKNVSAVEDEIRNLLNKAGLPEFSCTTENGRTVQISKSYAASIAEKRKHVAYQWLRDNDFEDIIKNEIKVPFGRGSDEEATVLKDYLEQNEIVYDQKETVHAGTLKAFVNEQLAKGVEVPKEAFGIFEVVKIKSK